MLAFKTNSQAIAYLVAFGVGTIISMAVFSTAMGWLASRCSMNGAKAYRGLMSGCSIAAMAVGVFWVFTSWK